MLSIPRTAAKLAALGLTLGIAASMPAQTEDHTGSRFAGTQFSLNYSYLRANAGPGKCGCFGLSGGSAELAVPVWRAISVVGDFSGQHTATTSTPGQGLSLVFFTAGPRLTIRSRRAPHLAPFVQGVVGAAHGFDAMFPTITSPTSTSATGLAAFIGGGLDIGVSRRLSVRAFQVDYGLTHLPNDVNDSQNLLRVSGGIVLRAR